MPLRDLSCQQITVALSPLSSRLFNLCMAAIIIAHGLPLYARRRRARPLPLAPSIAVINALNSVHLTSAPRLLKWQWNQASEFRSEFDHGEVGDDESASSET
jgi:hypothetical protein